LRLDKLLAEQILELIDAQIHKLLGAIQDGRVVLGGSAGSAGGVGDPPAGFWGQLRQANVTYDTAGSRPCASGSAGSDSLVDNLDAIRLGWEICDDAINEDHIDWGFGAGQVSAVDVPFATTSGSIDAANVRDAIEETYAECYGNGGNGLGDHDHSGSGSGGSILDSHMVTGDLILDDGAGDSPHLMFVGGTHDDTARIFLDDSPVAGRGRLIVRIPSDQTQSALEVQDPSETLLFSVSGIGKVRVPDGQLEVLYDGAPPVGYFSLATDETNTVQEIWGLRHGTSQTPLAGFGGRLLFELYNAASSSENAAAIDAAWDNPADGSEDSRLVFNTCTAGSFPDEIARLNETGLVVASGKAIYAGRISAQTVMVGEGCEYDKLAEGVAAANSLGPPTANSRWDILILGDTTESGGSIGIPQYCDVCGIGDPVIDMGANVIEMGADSSVQNLIIEGMASHVIGGNGVANVELRNVKAIIKPSGLYSFHFRGASTVRFLNCIAETTSSGSDSYGFYFRGTTQATLINCVADDVNGFDTALGADDTTTVTTLGGRFVADDDDVWVAAGATWNHLASGADPSNITILGTSTALPQADPRLPAGAIILWDNSDVAPSGYTRVAGADDRYLYAVAAGAGGTGGNATHSHALESVDYANWQRDISILSDASGFLGTAAAGADTLPFYGPNTTSVNTDPLLYKVLVCEKD
jgi:hypothetical protein